MNSKSRRFFLYLLMAIMVVTQVAFTGTEERNTSSESVVNNTDNTDHTNETTGSVQEQPSETATLEVKKNSVAASASNEVAQAVMIRIDAETSGEEPVGDESTDYDVLADHYLGVDESKEESEYQDMVVCYVDPYLPVRSEASRDSKTLGKLYPGSYADVVERGETWSKVKSGNLEGWVQNMYVCFDQDAEDLAGQLRGTLSTGLTLAEEKKQQEELAKKQAAALAAANKNQSTTSSSSGVSVSSYEECLLAAIVDWEANSEPMEGQLAVAYVVLNRVSAGYGNSIEAVISARGQFGGVMSGGSWSDAFQKRINSYVSGGGKASCRQAAAEALAGVNNPLDAFYLHFNTVVGSVSQSQQIGNHIFYNY